MLEDIVKREGLNVILVGGREKEGIADAGRI